MAEIIVIGSGPAGVSAAIYATRAGAHVKILGTGESALKKAHKIENYYGFEKPITGEFLFEEGKKQALSLGVEIIEEEVVGVGYGIDGGFEVASSKGKYKADSVIIATGSQRTTPPVKGIKELEGKGISYCAVCDGFFFRGKDLGVFGTGQYAVHEATELLPTASSVTIFTNGKEMEVDVPAPIKLNKAEIEEITGDGKVEKVVFKDGTELMVSGVFIAVGVAGSSDLAKKLGVTTEGNKIMIDENAATNVPGIYAAGDCTGGLLQIAKAVHEGAKAGIQAVKFLKAKK